MAARASTTGGEDGHPGLQRVGIGPLHFLWAVSQPASGPGAQAPTLQSVIRRRAQSSQSAVIPHHLLHLSHLLSYLQTFVISTHFPLTHCNAAQPG